MFQRQGAIFRETKIQKALLVPILPSWDYVKKY